MISRGTGAMGASRSARRWSPDGCCVLGWPGRVHSVRGRDGLRGADGLAISGDGRGRLGVIVPGGVRIHLHQKVGHQVGVIDVLNSFDAPVAFAANRAGAHIKSVHGASSSSLAKPNTSASTSWSKTTAFCCTTVSSIGSGRAVGRLSRIRVRRWPLSCRGSTGRCMAVRVVRSSRRPAVRTASGVRPLQCGSRRVRSICRWKRTGMAVRSVAPYGTRWWCRCVPGTCAATGQDCAQFPHFGIGPKYRVSRRLRDRVTHTRGIRSPVLTARYG